MTAERSHRCHTGGSDTTPGVNEHQDQHTEHYRVTQADGCEAAPGVQIRPYGTGSAGDDVAGACLREGGGQGTAGMRDDAIDRYIRRTRELGAALRRVAELEARILSTPASTEASMPSSTKRMTPPRPTTV